MEEIGEGGNHMLGNIRLDELKKKKEKLNGVLREEENISENTGSKIVRTVINYYRPVQGGSAE